jgi:beta-galactosidase
VRKETSMHSRRKFLSQAAGMAVAAVGTAPLRAAADDIPDVRATEVVSLCGEWLFHPDADDVGTRHRWYLTEHFATAWRTVHIPHTWQVDLSLTNHRGIAWYRRNIDVPTRWRGLVVRIEFEAVFHSASVWINGQPTGEHIRKGYTAFALDITHLLHPGQLNTIVVRVDNAFDDHMLPTGRSSDWAHDGGITRPVQLLITPETFLESVDVEALPEPSRGEGKLTITAHIRSAGSKPWIGRIFFRVLDDTTGLEVLADRDAVRLSVKPGATLSHTLQATIPKARWWHFDHPSLYRLEFSIAADRGAHRLTTTFGVRRLECKDNGFYRNGERVRLMGVERMAGSNPDFGMAEPGD